MNARQFPQATHLCMTSADYWLSRDGAYTGFGSLEVNRETLKFQLSSSAVKALATRPLAVAPHLAAAYAKAEDDVKAIKEAEAKAAEQERKEAAKKANASSIEKLCETLETDEYGAEATFEFDAIDSTVEVGVNRMWFAEADLGELIDRLTSLRAALKEHAELHGN